MAALPEVEFKASTCPCHGMKPVAGTTHGFLAAPGKHSAGSRHDPLACCRSREITDKLAAAEARRKAVSCTSHLSQTACFRLFFGMQRVLVLPARLLQACQALPWSPLHAWCSQSKQAHAD